jgi:hypothetical protein
MWVFRRWWCSQIALRWWIQRRQKKNLCAYSSILFEMETGSRNFALVDFKHESHLVARNAIAQPCGHRVVYGTTVKFGSHTQQDAHPGETSSDSNTTVPLLKISICKC